MVRFDESVVSQKKLPIMTKKEKMILVEGMWIAESKADMRRAVKEAERQLQAHRAQEHENEIMERAARTGESPDVIRRQLRTEAHIAMENAGLGMRHRAL